MKKYILTITVLILISVNTYSQKHKTREKVEITKIDFVNRIDTILGQETDKMMKAITYSDFLLQLQNSGIGSGGGVQLPIATISEINAGAIDNKAISPLGLAGSQLQLNTPKLNTPNIFTEINRFHNPTTYFGLNSSTNIFLANTTSLNWGVLSTNDTSISLSTDGILNLSGVNGTNLLSNTIEVGDGTLDTSLFEFKAVGLPSGTYIGAEFGNISISYDGNILFKSRDDFIRFPYLTMAKIDEPSSSNDKSALTKEWAKARLMTRSADVLTQNVVYITDSLDTGRKIDLTTAGAFGILLNDTSVNIGNQFYFYNNTGSPVNWNFAAGNSAAEGVLGDLPDKTHGYARFLGGGIWTVIDGVLPSGGGVAFNPNDQFPIISDYTTVEANKHGKAIVTNGNIIIDDTGLSIEYDIYILNRKGADITFTFQNGGTSDQYGTSIPNLKEGDYAYLELIAPDVWSVAIREISAGGGVTNLGYTASTANGIVTNDTGTDATIPIVGINAGLASPADKVKIDGALQGTITDTQIGFGDANGDIIGSENLTFDGTSIKVKNPSSSNYASFEANLANNYVRGTFKLGSDSMINGRFWVVPDVPSGTYVGNGLEVINTSDTSQSLARRFGLTISESSGALIQSTSRNGANNGLSIGFTTLGSLTRQMTLNTSGTLNLPANPTASTHVANLGFNDDRYIKSEIATAPSSTTAPGTEGDVIYTSTYIYVCIATDTWRRTAITTW